MSCPLWRPDCQAEAAVNAGFDAVRGMKTVAGFVSDGVSMVGSLGGFLPLVLLVLLVLFVSKLFSTGKTVAVGVADGYTGGAVSRVKNAKQSVRQTVVKHASEKGRSMRVVRERGRGPQVQAHAGAPGIIKRSNDGLGKPKAVVVCAPDAGAAADVVNTRLGGARWSPAGSKPCPHGKDFTFTRRK